MTLPASSKVSITEEQRIELCGKFLEEWPRLLLYAGYQKRRWPRLLYEVEEGDLVNDALVDILEGRNRWPPIDQTTGVVNEKVSLFRFICGVIESNVYHRSKKARRMESLDASDLDPPADSKTDSQIIRNEFAEEVLKRVADDSQLVKIVEVLCEVPDLRPNEIAHILGMNIEQMRNAQKRLRRRLKDLKEENRNG